MNFATRLLHRETFLFRPTKSMFRPGLMPGLLPSTTQARLMLSARAKHTSAESSFTPLKPNKTKLGQTEPTLQITFTCTANVPQEAEGEKKPCSHRSTHTFSRRSYEHGIVIVECPGCKNKHLIADHMGWFASTPSHARPEGFPVTAKVPETRRTIEDLLREKGEKVTWKRSETEGSTWEISED